MTLVYIQAQNKQGKLDQLRLVGVQDQRCEKLDHLNKRVDIHVYK